MCHRLWGSAQECALTRQERDPLKPSLPWLSLALIWFVGLFPAGQRGRVRLTDTYVPDPNLGSRLEQAVDDRRNQVVFARTTKEGAKGPGAASVHTDKESNTGSSSASTRTANESDKDSSAGKESAKGSSPVNLVSSGIYSEKSAKSGEDKWGDLLDEDTSKEDAKGRNEEDWVTTDEDEDENEAKAEAAEARKRRSDFIVDVRSASELKEGVKDPGSASKADNMEDETSSPLRRRDQGKTS